MNLFDIVLIEKDNMSGLSAEDISTMLQLLEKDEYLFLDIEGNNSSAMGLITFSAADEMAFCYDDLEYFISGILNDMEKESKDGVYFYSQLKIRLTRE